MDDFVISSIGAVSDMRRGSHSSDSHCGRTDRFTPTKASFIHIAPVGIVAKRATPELLALI